MLNHQLWFQRNKCDRILKNIFTLISELIDWCYHLLILCSNVHFVKQRFTVKFNLLCNSFWLFLCCFFVFASCFGGSCTSNRWIFALHQGKAKWFYDLFNVSLIKCTNQQDPTSWWGGFFSCFCLINQYNSERLFCFSCCNRRQIDTADHIPDGVNQLICVTLALNFCPNSHQNE